MKQKKMKNIRKKFAILIERVSGIARIWARIYLCYITVVGFLYYCGVHRDTKMGQVVWGTDNKLDWELGLSRTVTSKSFPISIIILICAMFAIASVTRYISFQENLHYKYGMVEAIIACLLAMEVTCLIGVTIDAVVIVTGINIVLDIIRLIYAISCILKLKNASIRIQCFQPKN